jgi:hypothetical protein
VSRVAQSVCLATGWTTVWSGFDPRQRRKDFSSSLCIQTGSEVHLSSCTMGTRGPFAEGKGDRGVILTTHAHLVPRTRMYRSYTSSPPSTSAVCSGTALPLYYVHWSSVTQSGVASLLANTHCATYEDYLHMSWMIFSFQKDFLSLYNHVRAEKKKETYK